MCGITGFSGPPNPELLRTMTDMLIHRGPDADGYFTNDGANLGNRRLRIIDLSGGDQPIANEDETIWVIYNGEIYNYADLHRQLLNRGHTFRTQTDTELLVHLYEEYGPCFAEHLNGIYAFAIWDTCQQEILLGRDPFGVKPLHYTVVDGQLVFGSEIKAMLCYPGMPRSLNRQALHWFLNLRYVPPELTLFENIHRLPTGHVLRWRQGKYQLERFWNVKYTVDSVHDESYFVDGLRHHLRQAVGRQLVSDVPIGFYLSGGLDSTSIVALAADLSDHQLKTFSLGFDEPTDELNDAALIAKRFKTEHHSLTLQPEPLQMYPEVIWHAEEPKENILQGFLLARHARQHVTVALSGLGGDELFAGYQIQRYIRYGQMLHSLVPNGLQRKLFAPLRQRIYRLQQATGRLDWDHWRRAIQLLLTSGDAAAYYSMLRNAWDGDQDHWKTVYGPRMLEKHLEPVRERFTEYFLNHEKTYLEQALDAEFETKMVEDFLNNEDRVSMGNSLEVRVPFLDRDLVEFSFSIPGHRKWRHGEGKSIFRQAMRGIVPDATLKKRKWGFTFNSYHQFGKDLRQTAERILTRDRVEQQGLFNYDYLQTILQHPPSSRMYWHYFFLWNVVGLAIWEQMFLEGKFGSPDFDLEAYMT